MLSQVFAFACEKHRVSTRSARVIVLMNGGGSCEFLGSGTQHDVIGRRGNAVSREALLNEVWGVDYYGTTRTLDQLIVELCQKIEEKPVEPRHLLTVHTLGYRLEI